MHERQNIPWFDQYAKLAPEWVDADAAANLLEETKSAFLAQQMSALGDMPVSRAEAAVKASPEWRDYVTKMVDARKRANLLKARLEYIRMRNMAEQADNATRRAEMRLAS
jgi:hypothetical protein